jgi:predicted phage terminase large subunit-like protein
VEQAPARLLLVRSWDLAGTQARPSGRDPDWTAGVLMGASIGTDGRPDGRYYVCDVRRTQATPHGVEQLVTQTAALDGNQVLVHLEQEPGSAGLALAQRYAALLAGYTFYFERATGSKATRAAPLASQAEAGNVLLVRGPWCSAFLDELEAFPHGGHDDQVDAAAWAFACLSRTPGYDGPLCYNSWAPWPITATGGGVELALEGERPWWDKDGQQGQGDRGSFWYDPRRDACWWENPDR